MELRSGLRLDRSWGGKGAYGTFTVSSLPCMHLLDLISCPSPWPRPHLSPPPPPPTPFGSYPLPIPLPCPHLLLLSFPPPKIHSNVANRLAPSSSSAISVPHARIDALRCTAASMRSRSCVIFGVGVDAPDGEVLGRERAGRGGEDVRGVSKSEEVRLLGGEEWVGGAEV